MSGCPWNKKRARPSFAFGTQGIGIAPALLPHVFDVFVQANPSSRRAEAGLGLGLALMRSLVECQGGRVSAARAGIGQRQVSNRPRGPARFESRHRCRMRHTAVMGIEVTESRSSRPGSTINGSTAMSLGLILVILLAIFLAGGFSGRFGGYGYRYGPRIRLRSPWHECPGGRFDCPCGAFAPRTNLIGLAVNLQEFCTVASARQAR
jgi:hypothetical protein